ncbi:hypothetical protein IE53DRAFT_265946 [Violaceomyces palustris]|uniref:Uncharacterized protein n=1 Tax=Violaceomyces palustris TaxID=1673888 RepID=A0ACD0NMX6_9BASI|nr:hypothetical protein IE53DRAFT_265946 [Violaceomyces palustris]
MKRTFTLLGLLSATVSLMAFSPVEVTGMGESRGMHKVYLKRKVQATESAVPTTGVPLFIPKVGGQIEEVNYLGSGNGGSLVYQVLQTNAKGETATATLVEGPTGAEILGAQVTARISGTTTALWAGASCGFSKGIGSEGYCKYFENVPGQGTSFYDDGATRITAITTITPTPSAAASSKTATASEMTVQTDPAVIAKQGNSKLSNGSSDSLRGAMSLGAISIIAVTAGAALIVAV